LFAEAPTAQTVVPSDSELQIQSISRYVSLAALMMIFDGVSPPYSTRPRSSPDVWR
jgi:hypothetical protein